MSVAAPPAPDAVMRRLSAPVREVAGEPVMSVAVARVLSFTALAAWGVLHWMAMLEPAEPGRGWTALGVGLLAVAAMLAAGRLPSPWRTVAAAAAIVPLLALTLLAGRVADELLLPANWEELAAGISRGIADLPGVRVPYRGLDQWVRTDIPLGGCALVLLAALLAFWPRRGTLGFPLAALLVLLTLFVVPIVAIDFGAEFLRGAVFALLMVVYLRLEKLRRADTAAAAALAVVAVLAALAAAPLLNKDQPWFDYESWAAETSASKSTTFTWDHSYGELNWPRDGRELIRVRARLPAYWKAENLDDFDGTAWRNAATSIQVPDLPMNERRVRRWTQELRVSIRNLRSDQFITAGYAFEVEIPRIGSIPTFDGTYLAPRTLRRGDAYTAEVYTPRPTEAQRRRAGTDYADSLQLYTRIRPATEGIPGANRISMTFPFFGDEEDEVTVGPPTNAGTMSEILAMGELSRVYALSRELRAGVRTPDGYVQRVIEYLSDDSFTYNESPPPSASTLEGFLFDAKQGYCQQFSGAMALLLRMAGIPARVVTGFSTGATDFKTGEYVIRDFDAHSWVEVYYPEWGWITFDPTPGQSPARAQPRDMATSNGGITGGTGNFGLDPISERGGGVPLAASGAPWWEWPARVAAVLAVLGALALAARRWRRGAPPALTEFERALRRTRRMPAPGTTLHALEHRFARTPAAAGYVRAIRESRYNDTPSRPTRAQRRGLRSELGRGGGPLGRIRAWWALPPR